MTSNGFEQATPAIEQPQTCALDHTATGIGLKILVENAICLTESMFYY